MNTSSRTLVTVQIVVALPVAMVWEMWTNPWHIIHWNQASNDWHTPRAANDLKKAGRFLYRMESRDGRFGFDFSGEYRNVVLHKLIEYFISDSRRVTVAFKEESNGTHITESFEADETHPAEVQKDGWQAILNNFRKYAESSENLEIMHFEITIDNPVKKVYENMLSADSYILWTSVFNASSHFRGSWEKGSRILFLGTDSKGTENGMVSRIKENIPDKFVSIEHVGIVKNQKEILCGQEVDQWKGSLENYTFTPVKGKTLLSVDIDSNQEFRSYFEETWPKALDKLKTICEQ